MWMSGFRYIIASTITVQTIIMNNNERMEEKMRLKTKHFQEQEIKLKKDNKRGASRKKLDKVERDPNSNEEIKQQLPQDVVDLA